MHACSIARSRVWQRVATHLRWRPTHHRPPARCGRVRHVIGLYLAGLVRCGNDQAELRQPSQALGHRRARQASPPGQLAEADGDVPVRHPAARFEHYQVDLDRLAPHPRQIATVEEDALDPVGLHRRGDGHVDPRFQDPPAALPRKEPEPGVPGSPHPRPRQRASCAFSV